MMVAIASWDQHEGGGAFVGREQKPSIAWSVKNVAVIKSFDG